ncbi:MAG: glycine zipper domain-containing protein [Nitrospira sp.]|nr:glycine zipper domain-containing protein [Nitrospira sp.]
MNTQGHNRSRLTAGSLAALLLVLTAIPGCESAGKTVTDHKDTAIGAGVGGAGGAVIGGLAGGTKGAVIGGLLGVLAGGAVGNYVERQDKDRAAAAAATGYQASQGNVVRLENGQAQPSTARAGETVNLSSTYTILTPNNQPMTIQESREVRHDGAMVANPTVNTQRANGTFTSTVPIILPSDAQKGIYDVTTTVAMGDRTARSMTSFTVQ